MTDADEYEPSQSNHDGCDVGGCDRPREYTIEGIGSDNAEWRVCGSCIDRRLFSNREHNIPEDPRLEPYDPVRIDNITAKEIVEALRDYAARRRVHSKSRAREIERLADFVRNAADSPMYDCPECGWVGTQLHPTGDDPSGLGCSACGYHSDGDPYSEERPLSDGSNTPENEPEP